MVQGTIAANAKKRRDARMKIQRVPMKPAPSAVALQMTHDLFQSVVTSVNLGRLTLIPNSKKVLENPLAICSDILLSNPVINLDSSGELTDQQAANPDFEVLQETMHPPVHPHSKPNDASNVETKKQMMEIHIHLLPIVMKKNLKNK